eukprot:6175878-Prymnesium_polylepis.1
MARVSFPGRDGINVPVRGQILKSTGDTYYENFVVTPKGSIYRTPIGPSRLGKEAQHGEVARGVA